MDGGTVLELARRVRPGGRVVGVDVSRPMLELASERAQAEDLRSVTLHLADASTFPFDEAEFDLAFSRFGVMFFDDPVTAFTNVRRSLATGGRLACLSWRPLADRVCTLVALLALTAPFASAQSRGTKPISSIEFKPGAHATVLEGTVSPRVTVGPDMTNEGSERYSLRARSGQVLTMQISSGDHRTLFSLVKPSPAMSKIVVLEGAGGVKRWSGRLTESGDYLVTVFTHDQAASRFKLRITLR